MEALCLAHTREQPKVLQQLVGEPCLGYYSPSMTPHVIPEVLFPGLGLTAATWNILSSSVCSSLGPKHTSFMTASSSSAGR